MSTKAVAGENVLTLGEAARFVRISEKTLGELARSCRIPSRKVGREWRFLRRGLEEWLQGQTEKEPAGGSVPSYRQGLLFGEEKQEGPQKSDFGDTAFTKNKAEPLHRWVPWIAGYSADFVEKVFQKVVSAPSREVTVLDPFAGVGTTLVEGLKRGYHVIGFEINPYACLTCRIKLNVRFFSLDSLSSTIKKLSSFMRQSLSSPKKKPKSTPPTDFKSKLPFFNRDILRQVLFVLDYINEQDQQQIRDLLKIALGSVMVRFSNYSYEPSLSTRSAAGKTEVNHADVEGILSEKLWEMAADIEFLQRHLSQFPYHPEAVVHHCSYLTQSERIDAQSVNILITSPPYLNNYHYVRNTRPQLYWLDLLESPKKIKELELESFGRFWQNARLGPDIDLAVDIPQLHSILDLVRSQNPEKGAYGGPGWANYAAMYFNDCDAFCRITRRVMKPGGHVIVVIGNNILQGVEIKTDEFFAQIAQRHGFNVLGMHRVRRKRTGSSIVNSSVRAGVMKKRTELYETAVELQIPC